MSHSTGIETNGVEQIPDDQRDASPLDLFRLIFGGANTFATAVLGSFPCCSGCRSRRVCGPFCSALAWAR